MEQRRTRFEPIASRGHCIGFTAGCLAFLALGLVAQLHSGSGKTIDFDHRNVVPLYLGTVAGEWGFVAYVYYGVRARGGNLFALLGRWTTASAVVADILLGAVSAVVLLAVWRLFAAALGPETAKSIDPLLPRGPLEIALWVAVSITAGIAEELVYRGYLMHQLAARFQNLALAVVAQGVWFGVLHAYEGLHAVVSIVVLGIGFGVIAVWRRQLRTGTVAHALYDIVSGLVPGF